MSNVNAITNLESTYNSSTQKISSDSTSDFSSFLGESKSLDEIFDQAADKYNIPVELLKAVGKTESNFDANAVSRCGAQGIMQLMPATAKSLGVTNAFDAEQNINGGAKYISALLKRYDGNTSLALAAYNAGSGNVEKYGGIPPFTETQNYVKKVLGYMGSGNLQITSSNSNSGSTAANNTTTIDPYQVAPLKLPTSIQSNYSYLLTNSTGNDEDALSNLNSLFNYDDYLKFLDIFLEDGNEADTKENTTNYTTSDINYSAPVLNLLMDQKLNQ